MHTPNQTLLNLISEPVFEEKNASALCADVALNIPIHKTFSYEVPHEWKEQVQRGSRVAVSFGSQRLVGVVLNLRRRNEVQATKIKKLSALVESEPILSFELIHFLQELAAYYLAPIGEVIALALPAIERRTINNLREIGAAPNKARVAPLHTQRWVRALGSQPTNVKLGRVAQSLFDSIVATPEISISELTKTWPQASALVQKLKTKGLVEIDERIVERSPFTEHEVRDVPPMLTQEQAHAVATIDTAIQKTPAVSDLFLLQGVTGSGKTEVYLRVIQTALSLNRGALILVPEIALTPQLLDRFRARFGDAVAVIHSALDPAARHSMWRKLHEGTLRVAIGARSALFAPVQNLGLVIVDEEHDASFKQEEGVRYHARDGAILRAHRAHAVCVLGSATPSLETIELVRKGRGHTLILTQRARSQPLPSVEIIDLRTATPGPTGSRLISLPLHCAIESTLQASEQIILFLNRRGFAPSVRCDACGSIRECRDCDVALTYHRTSGIQMRKGGLFETVPSGLRCHYCDRVEPLPIRCPKCGGNLAFEGVGTERLEDTLKQSFPRARIARLDRDAAQGRQVESILKRMRTREIDILVGTQMVAKGHDLPFVTLVGVVNADAALSIPDFRASERTFQLLVQVAGRAGRGQTPGVVFIQTRTPEHTAIQCACNHDVNEFLQRELEDRSELHYPPISRLILIRLEGQSERKTLEAARILADAALETPEVKTERVDVKGPTPAPIARVRERFRYRILLRGSRTDVRSVAKAVQPYLEKIPNNIRTILDVDPISML